MPMTNPLPPKSDAHETPVIIPFKIRALSGSVGWMSRAIDQGFRVTWRDIKFGRTEYVIKDGTAIVHVKQAPDNAMNGIIDEPTLAQEILLKQLCKIGLVEMK